MRMRPMVVTGVVVAIGLSGCGPGESSGGGDCVSHYDRIAEAPTLEKLKQKLVAERPRGAFVKVVGRDGDQLAINVLSAKQRLLVSLDAWRLDNGRWTAEQWSQCID